MNTIPGIPLGYYNDIFVYRVLSRFYALLKLLGFAIWEMWSFFAESDSKHYYLYILAAKKQKLPNHWTKKTTTKKKSGLHQMSL